MVIRGRCSTSGSSNSTSDQGKSDQTANDDSSDDTTSKTTNEGKEWEASSTRDLTVSSVWFGVWETGLVIIGVGTDLTFNDFARSVGWTDTAVLETIKIDKLTSNEVTADDWFTVGLVGKFSSTVVGSTSTSSISLTNGSEARISILTFGVIEIDIRTSSWVTSSLFTSRGGVDGNRDIITESTSGITECESTFISSVVGAQRSEFTSFGGIVTFSNFTWIRGLTSYSDRSSTSGSSITIVDTLFGGTGGGVNTSGTQGGLKTSSGGTEDREARISGNTSRWS